MFIFCFFDAALLQKGQSSWHLHKDVCFTFYVLASNCIKTHVRIRCAVANDDRTSR